MSDIGLFEPQRFGGLRGLSNKMNVEELDHRARNVAGINGDVKELS